MNNSQEIQENSNEIKSSISLFHPNNLISEIGKIFYAPFKKLFTKSPFEEHNFGTTENDICNDLSEYFQGTYERALIGESFDVSFQKQPIITNQEEQKLNTNLIYIDVKDRDDETPTLIEEEPSIRSY